MPAKGPAPEVLRSAAPLPSGQTCSRPPWTTWECPTTYGRSCRSTARQNIPEFGTLKNEEDFHNLLAISAYHRAKDKTPFPAVLLTTGINDPRVGSWQMGKMTARLQSATSGGKPVLLRVDYDGGHGGIGATRSQHTALVTDQYSFLLWQLGDAQFQPVARASAPAR